jgi:hypothetical protein
VEQVDQVLFAAKIIARTPPLGGGLLDGLMSSSVPHFGSRCLYEFTKL